MCFRDDGWDRLCLLTPAGPGKDTTCGTRRLHMGPDARPRGCPRRRARQGRLARHGRLTGGPEAVLPLGPLYLHARHQQIVVILEPPLLAPRLELGSHRLLGHVALPAAAAAILLVVRPTARRPVAAQPAALARDHLQQRLQHGDARCYYDGAAFGDGEDDEVGCGVGEVPAC